MSRRLRLVVLALAAVGLALGSAWGLRYLLAPRLIARGVAPDGTELCVVQEYSGDLERFATSLVHHRPGQPWSCHDLAHAQGLWLSGGLRLDPTTGLATVLREGTPLATYAWATRTVTLAGDAATPAGPPRSLPASWTPEQSVFGEP